MGFYEISSKSTNVSAITQSIKKKKNASEIKTSLDNDQLIK